MRVWSLFSGIGGFDLGFEQAGMQVVGQTETDRFCNAVLSLHWPGVERTKNVKQVSFIGKQSGTPVDVICGGFPCQDLSVAGKRAGLDGKRSGLWYEFHRIITGCLSKWVVIENVPGLLSSNQGRDFAIVLGGLAGAIPSIPEGGWRNSGFIYGKPYSAAWRVLDSQFFGVPQRRRRVFIVASAGDPADSFKVLFDEASQTRDYSPRREARKGNPAAAEGGAGEGAIQEQVGALTERDGKGIGSTIDGKVIPVMTGITHQNGRGVRPEGAPAYTLDGANGQAIAYTIQSNDGGSHKRKDRPDGGLYIKETDQALTVGSTDPTIIAQRAGGFSANRGGEDADDETAPTLRAGNTRKANQPGGGNAAIYQWASGGGDDPKDTAQALRAGAEANYQFAFDEADARRLTPLECERLQGFPDAWTAVVGQAVKNLPQDEIDYHRDILESRYGIPFTDDEIRTVMSDTQRYKQLGNAVTVSVVRWIGERMMAVERGEL